jgi:hypothetical protein
MPTTVCRCSKMPLPESRGLVCRAARGTLFWLFDRAVTMYFDPTWERLLQCKKRDQAVPFSCPTDGVTQSEESFSRRPWVAHRSG